MDFSAGGLLEKYRKTSTFHWKKLKLIIFGEESLLLQNRMFEFYMNNPLFSRSPNTLLIDEQRHLSTAQMIVEGTKKFYTFQDLFKRPELQWIYAASLTAYDSNFTLKVYIQYWMFVSLIRLLGTDRLQKYLEDIQSAKIIGCCAITEVSHGSNAKQLRTTATYDPSSKAFILNTPDFEAAKCWAGSMGKTCTHAIVFAQLYTADGICYGLNAFLVPIRDMKNMLPFPGVIVGDLGEKIGLNGIDNGFVIFNNYKIKKENLLSKLGDVTDDGRYVTFIEDKKKRLAVLLGPLLNGRVYIVTNACCYLTKATTIAVRYSAIRKQLGTGETCEELPHLEYQAQQYKLFPYLAANYALIIFSRWLINQNTNTIVFTAEGQLNLKLAIELHAISSACKSYCTWLVRDGIKEASEACGGDGYLTDRGFQDLKTSSDASCTYEGENNVLLQQASNWLISIFRNGLDEIEDISPLNSITFLKNYEKIINLTYEKNQKKYAANPKCMLHALEHLCAYLLKKTIEKYHRLQQEGASSFDARNNSQVFHSNCLALCYAQYNVYRVFYTFVESMEISSEKDVMMDLVILHGANLILQNSGMLYQSGYFEGASGTEIYESIVLKWMERIKLNAVSLIDTITYPNFFFNGCLENSDGDVYEHIKSRL